MDARGYLDMLVAAAAAHGAATERGDYKVGNKKYRELKAALQSLRSTVETWPEVRQERLSHEHPHVRCWAATHLLAPRPGPAVATLESLASQPGIAAFNAQMVLREWRAGRLRAP